MMQVLITIALIRAEVIRFLARPVFSLRLEQLYQFAHFDSSIQLIASGLNVQIENLAGSE